MTFCASFAPPVGKYNKCSVELSDFWPPNSPALSTFHYKIWAASLPQKAQDVNDLKRHLFDA